MTNPNEEIAIYHIILIVIGDIIYWLLMAMNIMQVENDSMKSLTVIRAIIELFMLTLIYFFGIKAIKVLKRNPNRLITCIFVFLNGF